MGSDTSLAACTPSRPPPLRQKQFYTYRVIFQAITPLSTGFLFLCYLAFLHPSLKRTSLPLTPPARGQHPGPPLDYSSLRLLALTSARPSRCLPVADLIHYFL